MINRFFIKIFIIYQKYISPLSFGSCRYYPTCSEFAKWQLSHDNIFSGLLAIILRILRCNKFFAGGIDYPKVRKKLKTISFIRVYKIKTVKIKFWLVPFKKNQFFVIKTF